MSIILLKGCHSPRGFFVKYKRFDKSARTIRKGAGYSSGKTLNPHLQIDGSPLLVEYSQKCLTHHSTSVLIRCCPPSLQLCFWPSAWWIRLCRTSLQFPEQFGVFPASVSLSMLFLLPKASFPPCPPGDPGPPTQPSRVTLQMSPLTGKRGPLPRRSRGFLLCTPAILCPFSVGQTHPTVTRAMRHILL